MVIPRVIIFCVFFVYYQGWFTVSPGVAYLITRGGLPCRPGWCTLPPGVIDLITRGGFLTAGSPPTPATWLGGLVVFVAVGGGNTRLESFALLFLGVTRSSMTRVGYSPLQGKAPLVNLFSFFGLGSRSRTNHSSSTDASRLVPPTGLRP